MSFDLAGYRTVRPPAETSRLIPSQFPPIPAFETVSTAADTRRGLRTRGMDERPPRQHAPATAPALELGLRQAQRQRHHGVLSARLAEWPRFSGPNSAPGMPRPRSGRPCSRWPRVSGRKSRSAPSRARRRPIASTRPGCTATSSTSSDCIPSFTIPTIPPTPPPRPSAGSAGPRSRRGPRRHPLRERATPRPRELGLLPACRRDGRRPGVPLRNRRTSARESRRAKTVIGALALCLPGHTSAKFRPPLTEPEPLLRRQDLFSLTHP